MEVHHVNGGLDSGVNRTSLEQPTEKSLLPYTKAGMRITLKDLSYSVTSTKPGAVKGEQILLLERVNGYMEPGSFTALMGPSGSGKTTLLDVLAGRKTVGTTTGEVLYGGQVGSRAFLRRYTGYVEQFDTLLALFTVEEMLMYTAELKRPVSEPLASKKAAVEAVMDALALLPCRDTKIGNASIKGISGGQAKRVNIGLDSFTANEVMGYVCGLVSDGVTIAATIHSPTAYCFGLFDSLLMLARGRVLYFGEQGDATLAYAREHWPQSQGRSATISNPAEYLVDIITLADREGRSGVLADVYADSALAEANVARLHEYLRDTTPLPDHLAKELAVQRETVTPAWFGLKTLIKYRTPRNYKDSEFVGPRVGDKLVMTTLMWTLFWDVGSSTTSKNVINQSAILFMWCILPGYGAAGYVPSIVLERTLYTRERSDGLYLPLTYLLAKMFDELLLATVASIVFSAASFYAISFQGSFGLFWLVYVLDLYIGIVLAYFVATISPSIDVANAVLPTYVTFLLFFGGFILDFNSIPGYWLWFSYIDFIRYAWSALMVNQFEGQPGNTPTDAEGKVGFLGSPTVLEHFGIQNYHDHSSRPYTWYVDTVQKWANIGFLVVFFWGFFFCAWMALKYKRTVSR